MTNASENNLLKEWLRPSAILQIVGFIALVIAAWSQIGQNSRDIQNNKEWIIDTRNQLKEMNGKLDRLIERNKN